MKPDLSILILARDEESRLPGLFESFRLFNINIEVVILENGSRDQTAVLARKLGAKVHKVVWQGYGATKNAGIHKCRADWILSLDADEQLDARLAKDIEAVISAPGASAYELCRLNYFLGLPIRRGGWFPDWQLRLFRKGAARFNLRPVHEGMEMTPGSGFPGHLDGLAHHHSYPDMAGYLYRLDRYTSLQADEKMQKEGKRPWLALTRAMVDPPITFLKMILFKAGFRDGIRGWILACLSAGSTFWKYAKWWQRSR